MIRISIRPAAGLWLVFGLIGCGGPGGAAGPQEELAGLGFQYTQDGFLRAIQTANLAAVELFIEAGINVDAEGLVVEAETGRRPREYTVSPLVFAAARSADMVPVLLDHGADVNQRSVARRTALSGVYVNPNLTNDERRDLALMLLDRGADPNAALGPGDGPLDWAVRSEQLEVVQELLRRGATVSPETLAVAAEQAQNSGNEAILEALRDAATQ